jgi:hypothetical protein
VERPDTAWHQALLDVLAGSHLATGADLGDLLEAALAPLRLHPELLVVDHEHVQLRPLRASSLT